MLADELAHTPRRRARRHHDFDAAVAENTHAQASRACTLPHRPAVLASIDVQELQLSQHMLWHAFMHRAIISGNAVPHYSSAMHWIDVGANLTHDSFDRDRSAVIERARGQRVLQMIVTGASVAGSVAAMELARLHP